jgi:hypothetical protein
MKRAFQSESKRASAGAPDFDLRLLNVDRDLRRIRQVPVSRSSTMITRGPAIASNADTLHQPIPQARRSAPRAGDILVSERSARADVFTVSIVPTGSGLTVTRYSAAIERVRELARTRRVDGWYTCDHTHYARLASYRP